MLVPEPDNPVDRNAILVYAADDLENDIGHLHSSAAKYIARMTECGATFSAEVYYIHHGYKNYPEVCIFIYQLTPMIRKRRPIRKDAPLYKPEPSSARRGAYVSRGAANLRVHRVASQEHRAVDTN